MPVCAQKTPKQNKGKCTQKLLKSEHNINEDYLFNDNNYTTTKNNKSHEETIHNFIHGWYDRTIHDDARM